MKFGSVCSGIEAASVAWEPLGWQAQFVSEIDPFPCSVLAHHWPSVPNHGDMTKYKEWDNANIDVLVGGTPCQSFSVAGLRKGLDDPRGNLMLTFGAIAAKYQPRWLVWENVPGVLSANGGRDFGTFLWMLGQLGYGFAYRVLDAQYFGVAQRRRRVFVVGHLGDWRPAAAVLFERHSLSGNPAPSREAREEVAGTLKACAGSGGWSNSADHAAAGYMIPEIAKCLTSGNQRLDTETETETMIPVSVHGTQDPIVSTDRAHALGRNNGAENAVLSVALRGREGGGTAELGDDVAGCLRASSGGGDKAHVLAPSVCVTGDITHTLKAEGFDASEDWTGRVRRLTPVECERLQGFPDGHTQVPHRGRPAADGPRYKALGNSMAVPVMRWIGERIQLVDDLTA